MANWSNEELNEEIAGATSLLLYRYESTGLSMIEMLKPLIAEYRRRYDKKWEKTESGYWREVK